MIKKLFSENWPKRLKKLRIRILRKIANYFKVQLLGAPGGIHHESELIFELTQILQFCKKKRGNEIKSF